MIGRIPANIRSMHFRRFHIELLVSCVPLKLASEPDGLRKYRRIVIAVLFRSSRWDEFLLRESVTKSINGPTTESDRKNRARNAHGCAPRVTVLKLNTLARTWTQNCGQYVRPVHALSANEISIVEVSPAGAARWPGRRRRRTVYAFKRDTCTSAVARA